MPRRLQKMRDEIAGRRFPLRACHSNDVKLPARETVEKRSEKSEDKMIGTQHPGKVAINKFSKFSHDCSPPYRGGVGGGVLKSSRIFSTTLSKLLKTSELVKRKILMPKLLIYSSRSLS